LIEHDHAPLGRAPSLPGLLGRAGSRGRSSPRCPMRKARSSRRVPLRWRTRWVRS